MIAPFAVSGLSVAGSATICTRSRAGNQLTRSGADSRSHVRGAELMLTVPARWEPLATTPTETVSRGVGNRSVRGPPASRSTTSRTG